MNPFDTPPETELEDPPISDGSWFDDFKDVFIHYGLQAFVIFAVVMYIVCAYWTTYSLFGNNHEFIGTVVGAAFFSIFAAFMNFLSDEH